MDNLLAYLTELENNNERPWFHMTALRRRDTLVAFQNMIGVLALSIGRTDPDIGFPDPKNMVFSLVRDTRFSHDKTPYNPSLRAHIGPGGKRPIPTGYYVKLMPGGRSLLAGGLSFSGLREATHLIRRHIDAHGDRLVRILEDSAFSRRFTLTGEKLVHIPREYDPGHPYGELLKHKSWRVECPLTDEEVTAPGFIDRAAELFRVMRPFKDFINEALEGYTLPADW